MLIQDIVKILTDAGIEQNEANIEVKLLIEHFAGYTLADIIMGKKLTDEMLAIVEEKAKLSSLPTSLDGALDALEADHDYLTAGGVFPEHLIKNFIARKRAECREMAAIPHPAEFDKYFNL